MGFGYLFAGYLIFFNFTYYHVYTDVFAALVLLLGLSSLKQYAKGFRYAFYTALPLAAVGLFSFAGKLLSLFEILAFPTELNAFLSLATLIVKGLFVFFSLSGVAELAKETDIPVLRLRALRNRALSFVFYLLGVLLESNLFTHVTVFLQYLTLFYMLYGILCTFLNAKTFFESYVWICLEGDEDMERRESRFGLINKLNALSDRLDKKTLARKEAERREKQEALAQKQGKKKKKK